ncbi:MAG: hypothetical protein HOO96_14405 [Polyangiaceae bacterium]|nr:hypothetical protein [Polyangiaceae bacterium]
MMTEKATRRRTSVPSVLVVADGRTASELGERLMPFPVLSAHDVDEASEAMRSLTPYVIVVGGSRQRELSADLNALARDTNAVVVRLEELGRGDGATAHIEGLMAHVETRRRRNEL